MITVLMLLIGFFRGIHEGMIHIRFPEAMHSREFNDGVRGHKWHQYYHFISAVRDLSMIGLGIALVLLKYQYTDVIVGLILMWEFSEVGHAISRVKYPVMLDRGLSYERIVFMDFGRFILRGNVVYIIHLFRIILALGVLYAN